MQAMMDQTYSLADFFSHVNNHCFTTSYMLALLTVTIMRTGIKSYQLTWYLSLILLHVIEYVLSCDSHKAALRNRLEAQVELLNNYC